MRLLQRLPVGVFVLAAVTMQVLAQAPRTAQDLLVAPVRWIDETGGCYLTLTAEEQNDIRWWDPRCWKYL
jgi:hypothetical protein